MRRDRHLDALVTGIALAVLTVGFAGDSAADNEQRCNDDLGKRAAKLVRGYQRNLDDCLSFGLYEDCQPTSSVPTPVDAENALRSAASDSDSYCRAAVEGDAVPISSIGPSACPAAWNGCDQAVPAISTVDDLANCLVCVFAGLDFKFRLDLDLPTQAPADSADRSCIRGAATQLAKAVRAGVNETVRCARGGSQPFSCPVDDAATSKFGKALDRISRKTARCKDASGQLGALGPAAAGLCNSPPNDSAGLATCLGQLARCQACAVSNLVYGQTQDCAAFSGLWNCDAETGALAATGSFYVTNAGDDTVTYYAPDGSFPGGSQAASTYPVGADPAAVAANALANAIYVANQGADSVSVLDATSGAHVYGSVAASIPVGAGPSALAIDRDAGLLYVANRGSDSVTFLDALTGEYAFGSFAASTFAVGDEPARLALSQPAGILAVANLADDTVTLLDAATGAYAQGSFAVSTFPAGPGIAGIAATSTYLMVTNGLGDTLSRFDPATGLPWFGSLADSTIPVRPQPGAATGVGVASPQFIASLGDDVVTVFPTFGPWFSIPVGADPVALAYGGGARLYVVEAGDATVSVYDPGESTSFIDAVPQYGCAPRIAHSPATGFLYAAGCGFYPTHGVVTFLDPSAPAYSFGTHAASAFDVGDCGDLSIAVNDATGTLYVTTYGPFLWSDEHVVFLDSATGSPKFGTVAASRFPLQGRASDVATSASANRVYVAEAEADAVTFFDATTGAYIGGTLAGSMVSVGGSPIRLAVNDASGVLFVSVPENDGIVMLDATTGAYANGTLAASTITVGATPRGLTYEPTSDVLYVANLDDDSVTMLDGTTGAYRYGTLAASTFPAGGEPAAIAVDAAAGRAYVANRFDLTVHDAATGAYLNGAYSNSAYRIYGSSREQVLFNSSVGLLYLGGYRFGCTYEEVEYLGAGNMEAPFASYSLVVTQATGAQPSGVAVNGGIASSF